MAKHRNAEHQTLFLVDCDDGRVGLFSIEQFKIPHRLQDKLRRKGPRLGLTLRFDQICAGRTAVILFSDEDKNGQPVGPRIAELLKGAIPGPIINQLPQELR